jgi:hypothetical protein
MLLIAPGGSKLVKTPFLDTTKLWVIPLKHEATAQENPDI